MKKALTIGVLFGALLFCAGSTGAQSAERPNKDAGLTRKGQHETMKALDADWKKAFAARDYEAADRAVQRILEVAPNLEEFKLPENVQQRHQFMKYSVELVERLTGLKNAIAARDANAVTGLTKLIENACTQCHTAFGGGRHAVPKAKGR